jgi:hypothetical protein
LFVRIFVSHPPSTVYASANKFLALLLLACVSSAGYVRGANRPPTDSPTPTAIPGSIGDPSLGPKVEALLRKMTLEEKVGQLVQYSAGQATGPGTGRTDYKDMIAKGQIGSMFNITKARDANAFQRIAVEQSRLHIPILFGLDVIHGFRTEFPIPLGLASTWDPALVERAAALRRRKRRPPAFAGPSHPWSILLAMRAGAEWRKEQAKIHFSDRPWQWPMFADTRVPAWMRPTASPPASSTTLAMEQPKAGATTTQLKFRSPRFARFISRHFARR